ncbi:MAG: type II toxin-antitoxin system prevent-host-death family antitoxin [Hydrogenophilales bacterium CG_4_9_14_3_um_filter_59_35]|nr:MAG: type II toxin-antitoxin system prevent-host-death family antitoxin [Hydrogenophilales bacterium CG18_big_fil_WC_8_21_14_2_50_58_12]PIX99525.1 MAG: type II toxin-antitoxin system prevent-host-death family antitoxin [Hydrogenophilales bacterium CG_4_10_14_3_um_filter_58_23]PJB05442.1 MAG: type II toxin-antitoxin system prevent-host-death family antitoxin [Hydrogenophilales bacterium CG_4_9_14_3_um_filter_59_35]
MKTWQIQEAKARLSSVLRSAEQDGPQEITHHGRSVAVLVSRADYDRLAGTSQSLVEFMRCSPLYGEDDLVIERDRSLTREIAL